MWRPQVGELLESVDIAKPLGGVVEAHFHAVLARLPRLDHTLTRSQIVAETCAQVTPVQREHRMDPVACPCYRDVCFVLLNRAVQSDDEIQWNEWAVAGYGADEPESRTREGRKQTGQRPGESRDLVGQDCMPEARIAVEVAIGADDDFTYLRGEARKHVCDQRAAAQLDPAFVDAAYALAAAAGENDAGDVRCAQMRPSSNCTSTVAPAGVLPWASGRMMKQLAWLMEERIAEP